jgi:HrpA-like RNA helicase
LVFLPGWDDISKLKTMLYNTDDFGDTRRYSIVQLHSGMTSHDSNRLLSSFFLLVSLM